MRGGRHSRFTVFDAMDAKGVFDSNPANASSPRYAGPVEYPKMFYHPEGKMREVQKAEIVNTPFGPVKVGEQFELINRTVHDAEEEARIRAAGWHDHPAKAIEASGKEAPATMTPGRVSDLEKQIAALQAQLSAARSGPPVVEVGEFDDSVSASIPSSQRPPSLSGIGKSS